MQNGILEQHKSTEAGADTVATVCQHLKDDGVYYDVLTDLEEYLSDNFVPREQLAEKVSEWMESTKKGIKIKNAVYKYKMQNPRKYQLCSRYSPDNPEFRGEWDLLGIKEPDEPLEIVDTARKQWNTRLRYQARSVAVQQKRPLIVERVTSSSEKGDDDNNDLFPMRFIYTSDDLLEAIISIVNPNASSTFSRVLGWGLIKLELKTPSIFEIRKQYRALHPTHRQLGVDDLQHEWFRDKTMRMTNQLIKCGDVHRIRHFAKKNGIPTSQRRTVWRMLLHIGQSGPDHFTYFNELLKSFNAWELITDPLYRLDVTQALDNENYFPFEDLMWDILRASSRDPMIPDMCSITCTTAKLNAPKLDPSQNGGTMVPQHIPASCIIPYHQQVTFTSPLAFVIDKSSEAYFFYRALFCRYWCRLNVISSRPDTIIYLCKCFEDLAQQRNPQTWFKCVSLQVHPLSIVFSWLFTAFSNYLNPEQVLILWDRVVAYDSLLIIPVLAAAIFAFRTKNLESAENEQDIQDIFDDGKKLRVIPLLQHFLFAT